MPVSSRHPEFEKLYSKIERTEAAFDGEVAEYVPKLTGQTTAQWEAYVGRAAFYGVTERTALALVGALVRKPFTLERIAGDEPLTDDAMFGETLQHAYLSLLLQGRIGLHVDYDEVAGSPKLVVYESEHIINWTDRFVVIEECVQEQDPDDEFVTKDVPQWRELRINNDGQYEVRLWRQTGRDQYDIVDVRVPLVRGIPLTDIPFWFVTPYDTSKSLYNPPLSNLAELNIQHFKVSVDLGHAAHFHALPQPWIAGDIYSADPNQVRREVAVGTETFLQLREGSTIGYLEPTGNGLPFLKDLRTDLETQMFNAGSRLLQAKNGVESAEALRIRSGSEGAVLETIASTLEHALTKALTVYNGWAGSTVEPVVTLNRDFTAQHLDPAELKALLEAHVAGVISLDTLLTRLFEGEIVADVKKERKALEAEKEAEPTPQVVVQNPNTSALIAEKP